MQPDGSYLERQGVEGKESKSSQETFIALAQKRKAAATRHKQSKLREKLLIYFHKRLQSAN
jgi:hypothetical protein